MNLERSAHVATPPSTAKHGQAGRPPASGAESAGETGAASFLSLLAAMDSQVSPDAQGDAALQSDALPSDALAADMLSALAPFTGGMVVALDGEAAGAASAEPSMGSGLAAAGSGASDLARGKGGSGIGAADAGASGRGLRGPGLRELGDVGDSAPTAAQARAAARKADASRQARDFDASSMTSNTVAERVNEARLSVERAVADVRAAGVAQTMAPALAGATLADPGAALKAAGAGAHSADRSGPASSPVAGGSALAGSWGEQAAVGSSTGAGPGFTVDPASPAASTALADKLSYWVSRGVQNAEIQLDAFGGGSVDVSISVHGNEAMVEFRSDQPEARRLLQEAMPQLRDMLRGEGLQLSGGFVGTSSQSDPGAQERRNQSPIARSRIVPMESVRPGAASAPSRTTGRTVDLFV